MDTNRESWQNPPIKVRVAAGGRLVIPAEVRQGLGIQEGDELLLTWNEHGARLTTVAQTVREIQAAFARYKKPGESVVDEFLAERREDAVKEEREFGKSRSRKKA